MKWQDEEPTMRKTTCPTCGAAIDADHPEGLCPACLLKKGLEDETTQIATPTCPSCRYVLDDDARFCSRCGAAVPTVAAAQEDPLRTALEAKLRGQYRIVRLLGRGGMGSVYLARDLTLDREVAIKVVSTTADSREMYDRFRREARTAARLSHPNIVPLHAFGDVDGMPYFVMGYVRGESLAARMRRDGRLSEEEARRVLAEIADALDHAHRQGVVHRDIKPDNVLLDDESGRALLTDFGVAKALGRGETLTQSGSVVGTPHFMSPEQASGLADLDGRSDIYSLGVMAYAMLAGRLPFDGVTPGEVLRQHLTQEPPPLRSLAPAVSDATLQVVERCLAKDPAKRWPDARSLKAALGAVESETLPDALKDVESHGVVAFGLALVLFFALAVMNVPRVGILVNASLFAIGYMLVLGHLRWQGFSFAQSQRVIWTEPGWWPFWYPRALRRRGSVWDRLPRLVRVLRWWTVTFWIVFAVFCINASEFFIQKVIALVAFVLFGVVLELRAKWQLKRKGLNSTDVRRVCLAMPPSRVAFWSRPHIAAILAPAPASEPRTRSESPHDQLQSIVRNASEMSGPLRELGAQAAAAARQVIAAIEDADREIAELARNIEPGEEERLRIKIDALDAGSPLRELFEKQLELIRGLSARIEEAQASRNRRVEMLKTLALHVASLRARSSETPTEVRSLTDRVRTLCEDIAGQTLVKE